MIPEGTRDDTLFRYACKLRATGMGESEILAALLALNGRCDPPLPHDQVVQKAKSAMRYEVGRQAADQQWQFLTIADALKPRPPIRYAIDGLLERASVNIVYASPGKLKSFLMADAGICVAAGKPWLPPLPGNNAVPAIATFQSPVIWVDSDNGIRRTQERIEALARAHKVPSDTPFYYVSMPEPWLDATNRHAIDLLTESVLARGAGLIIVDNLAAVSGRADENSADMSQVMLAFRQVAEGTGAAIVLIHHERKATPGKGNIGDSLSGHTSILAAIDLLLQIQREPRSDAVRVECHKARGAEVVPFGAMFTYETKPGTRELQEAMFYGVAPEGGTNNIHIICAIKDVVKESPGIDKTRLKVTVQERLPEAGQNRISRLTDQLVGLGELERKVGRNGAHCHYLPGSRSSGRQKRKRCETVKAVSQIHPPL